MNEKLEQKLHVQNRGVLSHTRRGKQKKRLVSTVISRWLLERKKQLAYIPAFSCINEEEGEGCHFDKEVNVEGKLSGTGRS